MFYSLHINYKEVRTSLLTSYVTSVWFCFPFLSFFQSTKGIETVHQEKHHYTLQLHTSTCTINAALLVRWPKEAL